MSEQEQGNGAGPRTVSWPDCIERAGAVNDELMKADWRGLWDYAPPNPPADVGEITRVEDSLGFRLPESYRTFLMAADGWPYFYQDITVFSAADLLGGPLYVAGRVPFEVLECIDEMAAGGVVAEDCFPVAATLTDVDVVVMARPGTRRAGRVAWTRGGAVVEQYADFRDYFLSMVEYSRSDVDQVVETYGPKPDDVPHAVLGHDQPR